MSDQLNKVIELIEAKRWSSISHGWAAQLSAPQCLGTEPDEKPNEIIFFQEAAAELLKKLKKGETQTASLELSGFRNVVFHTGIYRLYKSIHVINATQKLINNNYYTWSISNAYQSAYFACRAICSFFGIDVLEFSGKIFIVDIWDGLGKKGKGQGLFIEYDEWSPATRITAVDISRLRQGHFWEILLRVLRVMSGPTISNLCPSINKMRSEKDFTSQRHALHYQDKWLLEDMLLQLTLEDFGDLKNNELSDKDSFDFTVQLAKILIALAYDLLLHFKEKTSSNILNNELDCLVTLASRANGDLLSSRQVS